MSKYYRGSIAVGGDCRVLVTTNHGVPVPLRTDTSEFRDRIGQEEAFDWGRATRSTYVLARTLLADALGKEMARGLDAADFMDEVLAHFPKGPDWELSTEQIARWAESAMKQGTRR